MHFYQYEVVLLLKKEYWQMAIPDALNTKVHTFTLLKILAFPIPEPNNSKNDTLHWKAIS